MAFKRGNTYELKAIIKDIDIEDIAKVVFQFNDIEKTYEIGESGDVTYEDGVFTISLSQAETLEFNSSVKYEVAIRFTNGQVKRSEVKSDNLKETIIEKEI